MQLENQGSGGTIELRSQDDGVVDDMNWVQTGGPRRFLTRGASDSGVNHSMYWDSDDNLAPQQSSSVDENTSKIQLKAAAERAFDAVISVGPKDPPFPTDSIRGTMAFQSITNDLFDTTDIFTLETAKEGALMQMFDQNGDTTVTVDGRGSGGGAGGRVKIIATGVNGLGEDVKDQLSLEPYGLVGKHFVLGGSQSMDDRGGVMVSSDSLVYIDSTGYNKTAVKKGDRISLVGFGSFDVSKSLAGLPPDTAYYIDTLGNATFLGGSPNGYHIEMSANADATSFAIVDTTGNPVILLERNLIDDGGQADTMVVVRKGRIEFRDPFGNVIASYAAPGLTLTSTPTDTTVSIDSLGNAQFASTMTVGPTDPLATLTVAGDICATGTIGACSDARFKTDVEPITNSLERILKLRGVMYRWKQDDYPDYQFDNRRHIGVIAQELEKQFPELVMTDDDGYKSVDYSRLTPILVEAVKDQQAQIDDQNDRIEAQQKQIDELTATVQLLVSAQQRDDAEYSSR